MIWFFFFFFPLDFLVYFGQLWVELIHVDIFFFLILWFRGILLNIFVEFFGYLVFCTIFNMNLDLVVVYGVNRNCNLIFVYFKKKLCTNQTPEIVFLGISKMQSNTKKQSKNVYYKEKREKETRRNGVIL